MNNLLGLSINPQAWAVLQGLAYYDDEDSTVDTYAWYNGRERGILLVKVTGPSERLYVAFAECRSSDQIVIHHWEGESRINPPVVDNVPEDAWTNAKYIPPLRIDKAVKYIRKLLRKAHEGD